jgi:DNA-binding MarR family transcriptional regulator
VGKRAELIELMDLAGREISTAAVLFHGAVAARRGITATEEKALDVLLREGPLTHAELSHRTGLAPASVTGLIDRLERKGYAERGPHPQDRRRILISPRAEHVFGEMAPLFEEWVRDLHALYEEFDDEQLATIARFMREAAARQQEATRRLADA